MRGWFVTCVAVTLAAIAAGGSTASAADVLKVAVGQCGNWDSSPVQLGDGAGIYARHGIAVEAVCTQGTGETQQAVISGSADIGIGIGTFGALGAFAKGAPIRIISGSATGNADFWFVKANSPLKAIKDATDADHHRLFDQWLVHPQRGARTHPRTRPQGQADRDRRPRRDDDGGVVGTGGYRLDLAAARLRHARRGPHPHLRPRQRRAEPQGPDHPREHRQCQQPQGASRGARALHEGVRRDHRLDVFPDPKALDAYVAFRKTTLRNATRMRDEFFAKSALDPNTVKGMDGLMTEAVNLKYMSRVLTPAELAEFVQVPLK